MAILFNEDLYYLENDYPSNLRGEIYEVRRARPRAVDYPDDARWPGCRNCRNGNGRPTYISVHTKYLTPETLNHYGLPWEYHRDKDNQILIKEYINHEFQQELFAHSHGFKMAEKLAKTESAQRRADVNTSSVRRQDYESSRANSPCSKPSPSVSGGSVASEPARGRQSGSRSTNVSPSRVNLITRPIRSAVDCSQSTSPPKSLTSMDRHRDSRRRAPHSPAADTDLSPLRIDTGVSSSKRSDESKIERALLRFAHDYSIHNHLLNEGHIIENGRKLLQEAERGDRYREVARIGRELKESSAARQRSKREQDFEYNWGPTVGTKSARRRRRRRQGREGQGKANTKAVSTEDEVASCAKFEADSLNNGKCRAAYVVAGQDATSSSKSDETLFLTPSVDTEQQSLTEVKVKRVA